MSPLSEHFDEEEPMVHGLRDGDPLEGLSQLYGKQAGRGGELSGNRFCNP